MRVAVLGLVGLVGSVGCSRTFSGEAVQPNPIAAPTETLRSSEPITIVTGDMELEAPDAPRQGETVRVVHNHRYPLYNVASFTIVSRDRLRFHVQVDHKWQEWADLNTWEVHLEDGSGHTWLPESVEHARTKILTTMWDREQRTAICRVSGGKGRDGADNCLQTVALEDDGWRHRQTLGSLSVFRGNADFVFYQRDLMRADVRQLRLVVRRPGQAFEFTWNFRDTVAGN